MSRFGTIPADTHRRILQAVGEPAPRITEKQFMAEVIRLAKRNGWDYSHAYDSRKSEPGLPDLLLVHPTHGIVFAELKTDTGKLTPAQAAWIGRLAPWVRVVVWRPADWELIGRVLTGDV